MELSNKEKRLILLDYVTGCLFGGAYGDALGYPVEFAKYESIKNVYGDEGITELQIRNDKAEISDDTQMTLFTANGLLYGQTRGCLRGISGPISSYVFRAYQEWRETQVSPYEDIKGMQTCWIHNDTALHAMRAPGNTCMSAIANSNGLGNVKNPINDSKGCGGVMRVAPVGCFSACGHIHEKATMIEAAQIAALTHGHTLGYIPAAYLALLIHKIILNKFNDTQDNLKALCFDTLMCIREKFELEEHYNEFETIIYKAIQLSEEKYEDIEAIRELGEGWVAEEALAIAIYCALKYCNDFKKCIIVAVNHDGDSDSTGSIAGNIIGALLGIERFNIEPSFTQNIEANEIIFELAQDLVDGCQMSEYGKGYDAKWMAKYVYCTYKKN